MRLGSRDQSGPELLDDRLTWQNRAVGQLLGIAASDQRMPTGHTQVQIFHADSLRSRFLTIRWTRKSFLDAAHRWAVPALLFLCEAEPGVVRARLEDRRGDVSDADWA